MYVFFCADSNGELRTLLKDVQLRTLLTGLDASQNKDAELDRLMQLGGDFRRFADLCFLIVGSKVRTENFFTQA